MNFFDLLAPNRLAYISSGLAFTLLKYQRLGEGYSFTDREKIFIQEGIIFFKSAEEGIDPFASGARSTDVASFGCYINLREGIWPGRLLPTDEESFRNEIIGLIFFLENISVKRFSFQDSKLGEIVEFFTVLEELSLAETYVRMQEEESVY